MKRIFVIEDDPVVALVISNALKAKDSIVESFAVAELALEKIKLSFPDVLIIDYNLPGMSGIEVFTEVKNLRPPLSKIIMVSSNDDGSLVLKFIQKGIRNYVVKDDDMIPSILEILNEQDT